MRSNEKNVMSPEIPVKCVLSSTRDVFRSMSSCAKLGVNKCAFLIVNFCAMPDINCCAVLGVIVLGFFADPDICWGLLLSLTLARGYHCWSHLGLFNFFCVPQGPVLSIQKGKRWHTTSIDY